MTGELCSKEEMEETYTLLFCYFETDSKTPIARRQDYSHNLFFREARFAEFLLSIYNQIIYKKFLTKKQLSTMKDYMKKNIKNFQSINGKSISLDYEIERFIEPKNEGDFI